MKFFHIQQNHITVKKNLDEYNYVCDYIHVVGFFYKFKKLNFTTCIRRYAVIQRAAGGTSSTAIQGFDLRIGGLNETELYDLRQIPTTLRPLRNDVERFGVWSASFGMPLLSCGFALAQILWFFVLIIFHYISIQ